MSNFKIEWLRRYLPRTPTVILDVGTYDGADAIRFKQAFPSCRVEAFEADPGNVKRMMDSGECKRAGVKIHWAAVSDCPETSELFHPNTNKDNPLGTWSGSILHPNASCTDRFPFLEFHGSIIVPSYRLDDFCWRNMIDHIDLLHMDVQGAEGYVLEGLDDIRPRMIFLEIDETTHYDGAMPLPGLRALLARMGYGQEWADEHDALYVLR